MYVSTLQSFVKAMAGELKITARFPEGTVAINQFEDVKEARSGAPQLLAALHPDVICRSMYRWNLTS